MEKEIKAGVFISVITREKWLERTEVLTGDDLRFFAKKCNPAKNSFGYPEIGLSKETILDACKELEPSFKPETDYFVIRYAPPVD